MGTNNLLKHAVLFIALDGSLSLAVLTIACYYTDYVYTAVEKGSTSGKWGLVALMFFGMSVSQVIRVFLDRGKHRTDVLRHAVYALAFLACAGLILLGRQTVLDVDSYTRDIHFKLAVWLYEASLIFGRVLACLKDRTRRGTLINVAMIAVIVILMWQMEIISMVILIGWQCVAHVIALAFHRIDLSTLNKIVRKTYAAEIIFGILLLIAAFSLVLPQIEDGITSFNDSLWYCFAIVTTIGFGDITAVTPMGRIISVILGIYGIIVVSLITSIIVNFYGETKADDEAEQ